MDREKYASVIRERMIERFINEVNDMSDDDVIDSARVCPKCLQIIVNEIDQQCVIVEGTTPEEIDSLSGVIDHRCETEDDLDELEMEDDEDPIIELFRDAIDMLNTEGNPHIILSYLYVPEGNSDSDFVGESIVYGSRKMIDFMLNDIKTNIDNKTNDFGDVSFGNEEE